MSEKSAIEIVLIGAAEIEKILRTRFGAKGSGLTQLLLSVGEAVPTKTANRIFIIAKIRNQAAHNPSEFTLENVNGYMEICKLTISELKQATPSKAPRPIHKQAKSRWTIRRRPPGFAYSRVIAYFALMLVLVATPFIIFFNTVFIAPRSWAATALIAAMAIAGAGTLGTLAWLHKISASMLALVGISTAATLAIGHQATSQSTTGLASLALIVGVFALAATRP